VVVGKTSDHVSSVFLLEATKKGELRRKKKISGVGARNGGFCPWDFGGTNISKPKSRRFEGVKQGEFRKNSSHPLISSTKGG
jgi:hypothetical protein